VPEDDYIVPFGEATKLHEGSDITLVSWGHMARVSLQAAEALAEQGVNVDLIDLRTIVPLDIETVIESVTQTGRCVIVQEAPRNCGFASELMALINERAFDSLTAPLGRVTGYDTTIPLYRLESEYMPDVGRVMRKVKEIVQF